VPLKPPPAKIKLVVIGASAGGPVALQTILSGLPEDFSAPVLIVQHMAEGFIQGFVEWLAQTSALPIHVARHGEPIVPGHVYVAPDHLQMKVESGGTIGLSKDAAENGLSPSVSYLFRSAAQVFGGTAVGVLLTGMGKDGAEELGLMKGKGAITIVQDEASSVVYGMPGEAIKLGAATYVLSPDRIAAELASLLNRRKEGV
jgi:two-component system chemotaxis response regulator CheB